MKPKPKQMSEFSDTTLLIVWNDGHESLYLYEDLRNACPCASCTGSENWGGKGRTAFKKKIPIGVKSTNIRPYEIEDIGLYAVRFKWNDGHETGIYTFEFLRELCTCDACRPVA